MNDPRQPHPRLLARRQAIDLARDFCRKASALDVVGLEGLICSVEGQRAITESFDHFDDGTRRRVDFIMRAVLGEVP